MVKKKAGKALVTDVTAFNKKMKKATGDNSYGMPVKPAFDEDLVIKTSEFNEMMRQAFPEPSQPWRLDPNALPSDPINKEERKLAKRFFLSHLANCGLVSLAAKRAGLEMSVIKQWREKYPKFDEKIKVALSDFADMIEGEVVERALAKSDKLLFEVARAVRPDKYGRDSNININNGIEIPPVQVIFNEGEVGPGDFERQKEFRERQTGVLQ